MFYFEHAMINLLSHRATYDHERKVYHDHLESLQVMDKEYRTMAEEVAKLRAELSNTANTDKRAGTFLIVLPLCVCACAHVRL